MIPLCKNGGSSRSASLYTEAAPTIYYNERRHMNKKLLIIIITAAVLAIGYFMSVAGRPIFDFSPSHSSEQPSHLSAFVSQALEEKFNYLSRSGNSACSAAFRNSISSMPDTERLRGSCCSAMNLHRYGEQVDGLKKYSDIQEIPPDPYDVEVGLACIMPDTYWTP